MRDESRVIREYCPRCDKTVEVIILGYLCHTRTACLECDKTLDMEFHDERDEPPAIG